MRNGIYTSPNRHRFIGLKAQGMSDAQIAEWVNEVEDRAGEEAITEKQVHLYLNSQLTTSSTAKLMALQKGKDLAKYQAEADHFWDVCKTEVNAAVATGDAKRFDITMKHLDRWFQNRLLTNGIGGPQTNINVNVGKSQEDLEKDALLAAVKEWLKDTPEAWDFIARRGRELAQGSVAVHKADVIDVEPVATEEALNPPPILGLDDAANLPPP